jgi:hypothetical protein
VANTNKPKKQQIEINWLTIKTENLKNAVLYNTHAKGTHNLKNVLGKGYS